MPKSIASTEDGYQRVTPTTTQNNTPVFSASHDSVIDSQISDLNLNEGQSGVDTSSRPSMQSHSSAEELVAQKRREWYSDAWKKFLEKNNHDGVVTAVERYLDIADKSNIDIDCYFALVPSVSAKKGSEVAILDKIDMSTLSDTDLVDIHLLRSIVFLKCNDVEKATEEGKIASEKGFVLGRENDCHYIMALISCYSEDYVEAAFRKSLLPDDFVLKDRFANLIKRLNFKDAKWQIRGVYSNSDKPRYSAPIDITKELPIPARFMI